MKQSYYFSHDYNAREDEKIQKLLYEKGFEGYGIYWAIIEMLYLNDGTLNMDYERIAFILRTQSELIKNIIENFNLFEIADKKFTSRSVIRRLNFQKSKSEKAKKSAEIKWKKHYANAERTQSERNAINKKKRNNNKVKEIVKEKIISPEKNKYGEYVKLNKDEFLSLSARYGNESRLRAAIDRMNDYCAASRPKGYSDYAAALRNWLRRDDDKQSSPVEYKKPGEMTQEFMKRTKATGSVDAPDAFKEAINLKTADDVEKQ